MTEKEFTDLFGTHDEHYIKVGDLRTILVQSPKNLVSEFIKKHDRTIWPDDRDRRVRSQALKALKSTFGSDWESKLYFPELCREFRRLGYTKGIGRKTLQSIALMCSLNGFSIPLELVL